MMTTYSKPLPQPIPVSKEFWEAAKRHELRLQHCKNCDVHIFYPREVCPQCLLSDLEWVKASGRGRVHSYTIMRHADIPGFLSDVPYILAIVELEEGPRMLSNLVDCGIEDVKMDMPVTAVFDDVTPEVSLVKFKPA